MSESGHSQPGLYGPGRRRRRRRGDRDIGPPGQNLSGPSRDREYQPRERRVTLNGNTSYSDVLRVTHLVVVVFRTEVRNHKVLWFRRLPSFWQSPPGRGYCIYSQMNLFIKQVPVHSPLPSVIPNHFAFWGHLLQREIIQLHLGSPKRIVDDYI